MSALVLSRHRQAQIAVFCGYALRGFKNVTQAGRYALRTLSIAGDGQAERAAILAAIWEHHAQIARGEIPFVQTLIAGAALLLLTSCTPLF